MMRGKKGKANKGDGAPPPKENSTMISRCSLHPQWDQFQDLKKKPKRSPPPASFRNHDPGRPEHRNAYIHNIYLFLQLFTCLTV